MGIWAVCNLPRVSSFLRLYRRSRAFARKHFSAGADVHLVELLVLTNVLHPFVPLRFFFNFFVFLFLFLSFF